MKCRLFNSLFTPRRLCYNKFHVFEQDGGRPMLRLITGRAGAGQDRAHHGRDTRRRPRRAGGAACSSCPSSTATRPSASSRAWPGRGWRLHAEVLSFTGLARRVAAELGPREGRRLDPGGRLLCMAPGGGGLRRRASASTAARGARRSSNCSCWARWTSCARRR